MGAWDIGPFDNDDASDWLADLEDTGDFSLIQDALRIITEMDDDDYIEAGDGNIAIAAAEIVAALHGNPNADLPENAQTWVEEFEDVDAGPLISSARAALKRLRANSEVKQQWEESGDLKRWLAQMTDLDKRLAA